MQDSADSTNSLTVTPEAISASTSQETSLTSTPFPTLTLPSLQTSLIWEEFLLAPSADNNCSLPCWQGLRINVSTHADVQNTFNSLFPSEQRIDYFSVEAIQDQKSRELLGLELEGIDTAEYHWLGSRGHAGSFWLVALVEQEGTLQGLEIAQVTDEISTITWYSPIELFNTLGTPDEILMRPIVNPFPIEVHMLLVYYKGIVIFLTLVSEDGPRLGWDASQICLEQNPRQEIDYIVAPFESLDLNTMNSVQRIWISRELNAFVPPIDSIENVLGFTPEEFVRQALEHERGCLEPQKK